MQTIRRALISVSDKTAIVDFARALSERGVEILSTGGTARLLREAGLTAVDISEHTGFPEIMDGRVKTLHPRIHGGILARRGQDDAVMAEHGISPIDLVVVNLYPFEATAANPDSGFAETVEQIDIGGPAMLRAAAKNHAFVTTLVDTRDYSRVLAAMDAGGVPEVLRRELAGKCFSHTATYDGAIAAYFGSRGDTEAPEPFPATLHLHLSKIQTLRYGENPHQMAAFYADPDAPDASIAAARQLQGKALSYNNIADTDAALQCVQAFPGVPACVIVKHANPCGVAVAPSLVEAYRAAFATDSTSAFGGIVAFNDVVDENTAAQVLNNQFVEVMIMPGLTEGAETVLQQKPNVRVLVTGFWPATRPQWTDYKRVGGGMLMQDADTAPLQEKTLRVVTQRAPEGEELQDLLFAWRVAKFVKSNAIVYARGGRTVGVGAGQMSRVDSARIALSKARDAGLTVAGSVMASDAFFPFRDSIDAAAEAGIRATIQPGGSRRDEEVIAAANEADMAMLFTGMRHFRH